MDISIVKNKQTNKQNVNFRQDLLVCFQISLHHLFYMLTTCKCDFKHPAQRFASCSALVLSHSNNWSLFTLHKQSALYDESSLRPEFN